MGKYAEHFENGNGNKFDFSSDKVNLFFICLDSSGSMDCEERAVTKGLELYKKSFENFSEANSIAVSVSQFANSIYLQRFVSVSELVTNNYRPEGGTALFYSIVEGAEYLKDYVTEVTKRTGVIPRATFILFSDGEPCGDPGNEYDAKEAIESLNLAGITTVFVAFGSSIRAEFGKRLGFVSTLDVNNREVVTNFLGVELSKSCKEQSKSLRALGANFFSQNVGNTSKGFSKKTSEVLDDDSWISDI